MKFARIEMLFLIWALPVLLLAFVYGWRRRRRIIGAYANPRTAANIVPTGLPTRRRSRALIVLAAATLMVAALAGPQYGFHWQEIERKGIDIVIALDCSRSMMAADIQPTRLDRAKREIYDLLTMLQGDRVGLVAFSGTAFLQCPLTIDYPAFYLFLEVLTPDYLPVGGSDLTAALSAAQEAFDPQSQAQKAVILITDGENTGKDDPFAAAQAAQKAGIKLFCIGVGSEDGVPVPKSEGGFQKDAAGQIVLSRLDESLLTRMALATGGSYVRSVAGDMDLDTIYTQQIRTNMDAATVESGRKQVWAERFQWPLALAVILLLATRWIPLTPKPLAALMLFVLLGSGPQQVQAGPLREGYDAYQQGAYEQALKLFIDGQLKQPDRPQVLYNIGNAYYKTGDFKAALDHYTQALPKAPDDLKPQLLYNMGNSAFRQGQLEKAVKNFEAALQLNPDDRQARENLAFVKKQLQQQKQQQSKDSDQQGQENPDQQQKQTDGSQSQDQTADQNEQRGQDPSQSQEEGQPPPQYGSEMNQGQPQDPSSQSDQQTGEEKEQQGTARGPGDDRQEAPSTASQMLNRLKDQPGRATMPDYQKRPVDKDW